MYGLRFHMAVFSAMLFIDSDFIWQWSLQCYIYWLWFYMAVFSVILFYWLCDFYGIDRRDFYIVLTLWFYGHWAMCFWYVEKPPLELAPGASPAFVITLEGLCACYNTSNSSAFHKLYYSLRLQYFWVPCFICTLWVAPRWMLWMLCVLFKYLVLLLP